MTKANQQPERPPISPFEMGKIIQYLAIFPAITLMVFTRRKLGFRMLRPARLVTMTAILIFINSLTNCLPLCHPAGALFTVFPWIMLAFGLYQRRQQWNAICNGIPWHSFSAGISYLELLPLPRFLMQHRRAYRILEPALCFVASMVIGMFFSRALARWCAFASICMYIYEAAIYERALENDLNLMDNNLAAEIQGQTLEHFSGPAADQAPLTVEQTAGIATGVSPDLLHKIKSRRVVKEVTNI